MNGVLICFNFFMLCFNICFNDFSGKLLCKWIKWVIVHDFQRVSRKWRPIARLSHQDQAI